MAAMTRWISETPGFCTASKWDWQNQAWLYLVAEATEDGSWDWTTWSSDNTCCSLSGLASDRLTALMLAEQAAASIKRTRAMATA